ncbi:MAG: DNA topoisomerase III [Oscillospiraceae bacterium]|nr:DNA topoisomerase III [Oscillospiraceae bacterium]
MPRTLVVAEKPSVARDIARVLGCRDKGEGCILGDDWCVTWALGHLVTLMEPEELDERYKRWRAEDLPILPETMRLKVLPKTRPQFRVIKKLMADPDTADVVCATDAGREGELIFRYIYDMAGCKKPVRRLWISSMTDEAIREGFTGMRPGADYEALYQSARCRAEADWLVGMNASRAFTLRYGVLLSVGRVQTPTLAMLARRRAEIEAFVPELYWLVEADFGDYTGLWFDPEKKRDERRIPAETQAKAIAAEVRGKPARVTQVSKEARREPPPQLFDLTSLQREANQLLGYTAQKTLGLAQALYEKHKLITYPRTDSRCLPVDMVGRVKQTLQALCAPYDVWAKTVLAGKLPVARRVFDDARVSDHHAILPTPKRAALEKLTADERALYDLVARRFVAQFFPAYAYDALRVVTQAAGHSFLSLGRSVIALGWKEIYRDMESGKKDTEQAEQPLPALAQGDARQVAQAKVRQQKTKPPAPYTDASLLYAMEHAGREVADEDLRLQMKTHGLGTPATRAAIIERLMAVGYAARKGKQIVATDKGMGLIAVAPQDIASAETTGRWEKGLADIAEGEGAPDRFLDGIRRLTAHLVAYAAGQAPAAAFPKEDRRGRTARPKSAEKALGLPCPLCGQGKVTENSKAFGCSRWKQGCAFTLWKNALVSQGGPALTAAIVRALLEKGRLRGSTGLVTLTEGKLRFMPDALTSR